MRINNNGQQPSGYVSASKQETNIPSADKTNDLTKTHKIISASTPGDARSLKGRTTNQTSPAQYLLQGSAVKLDSLEPTRGV